MFNLISKFIIYINHYINNFWYKKKLYFFLYIFYPIEILYLIIIYIRKLLYKYKIFKTYQFKLPIIVVGNLTVGGTGKTPMVAYLANYLQREGFKVAVIMRGYGSQHVKNKSFIQYFKNPNSNHQNSIAVRFNEDLYADPSIDRSLNLAKNFSPESYYGDEPVMLAKKLNCPVIIGKNRVKSLEYLLANYTNYKLDLIISDDGLQHYALGRDVEIIMLDDDRYFGNRHLLPLGPLRATINDIKHADFIMLNKSLGNNRHELLDNNIYEMLDNKFYKIKLIPNKFYNLLNPNLSHDATYFNKVHAVAGIGNNQKFFKLLNSLNIVTINHDFPDHHKYQPKDLYFNDDFPIVMTEKDAIKCISFATSRYWQLKVDLQIEDEKSFQKQLLHCLNNSKKLTIKD